MKKNSPPPLPIPIILLLGWLAIVFSAYGRLILHPELHTACPENDTWNFPIRWSVLSVLHNGNLPLWNPLSAFGIPWLATWQTETFYPGTLLFTWGGLTAWNYSGILHLLILSLGIYFFLGNNQVQPFWAFLSASIALMNGCAYNHLGSNSSMDTMAWIPWMFLSTQQYLERQRWSGLRMALFISFQVFAGYPQIIFYTVAGCFLYAFFLKGWKSIFLLLIPLGTGLFLSSAQWLPSIEYFFFNCVRLPAVHDDPHFFLPLENLKTFFDFNALSQGGFPDYVASPTFFYFNFYSGFIPVILLALGSIRLNRLKPLTRFFLMGFFILVTWSLGYFLTGLEYLHIPYPAFLEPAKCWVLINVFELFTVGLSLEDFFPKPGQWKWAVLALSSLSLLFPLWDHPLENNLLPPNPLLEAEAKPIRDHLGSGRMLILPDEAEHKALYTPMPDAGQNPLFKHFIPNSNYFVFLPSATFYGSTQPSWGALDSGLYFQYGFPYLQGDLLDLLGIDLLLLPSDRMPSHFRKIQSDGKWVLWQNPSSLGSHFYFTGMPQKADRKTIFTAFASGKAKPAEDLFWDPVPVSRAPLSPLSPVSKQAYGAKGDYLIVTQNAIPGWRAWVDGIPRDIFLADGIFQAIPLSPSSQKVEIAYEPASFRLGLFLSLTALAFLGCGVGLKGLGWVKFF